MNIPIKLTDKFENLEAWQSNNSDVDRSLLLDIRKNPDYFIKNSTWISIVEINDRWSELPIKWRKFSVLVSDSSSSYDDEIDFLASLMKKGWLLDYQFKSTSIFFKNCQKLNLICKFEEIKLNILFDPNFYLKSQLAKIQNALSCAEKFEWKVMDLGCGSGRDLAYLSIQSPKWKCYGIDSWKGSISRCQQLFTNLSLENQLQKLYLMKFMSDGSLKDLLNGRNYFDYSKFDKFDNLFDFVIIIRFLVRENFEFVSKMLSPGGFLLICTFLNLPGVEYDSPRGTEHRLEPGELTEYFVNGLNFELIDDSVGYIEDGRPVNCFLVRKSNV